MYSFIVSNSYQDLCQGRYKIILKDVLFSHIATELYKNIGRSNNSCLAVYDDVSHSLPLFIVNYYCYYLAYSDLISKLFKSIMLYIGKYIGNIAEITGIEFTETDIILYLNTQQRSMSISSLDILTKGQILNLFNTCELKGCYLNCKSIVCPNPLWVLESNESIPIYFVKQMDTYGNLLSGQVMIGGLF